MQVVWRLERTERHWNCEVDEWDSHMAVCATPEVAKQVAQDDFATLWYEDEQGKPMPDLEWADVSIRGVVERHTASPKDGEGDWFCTYDVIATQVLEAAHSGQDVVD